MTIAGGSPRVMLLIDADNVSAGVMEQAVERLLAEHGALHVRRAYGTAESAVKQQALFKRLGIRPMVNLAAGKNSTDIALAVDALDLVISERPDIVVIASSDSDFAPLVARLREKGCRVCGIGQAGKTGDETIAVYDEFVVLAHRRGAGGDPAEPARGRGRRVAPRDANRAAARTAERAPAIEEPAARKAAGKRASSRPALGRPPQPARAAPALAEPSFVAPADMISAPEMPQAEAAIVPEPPSAVATKAPARKRGTAARKTARTRATADASTASADGAVAQSAGTAPAPAELSPEPAAPAGPVGDDPGPVPVARKRGGRSRRAGGAAAPAVPVPAVATAIEPAPEPAAAEAASAAWPAELEPILAILPELLRGGTLELNRAAERLRAARLLSRSASSTRLFGRYPTVFDLQPTGRPSKVRLHTAALR